MNSQQALDCLTALTEQETAREQELSNYPTDRIQESDDEAGCECPIMDSFVEADGDAGIVRMTNFTQCEFRTLYSKFHSYIMNTWNVGRGRKSKQKPMDMFFMTIVVMKHPNTWAFMGNLFKFKGTTFQRMITGFLQKIEPLAYELFIEPVTEKYTMSRLIADGTTFVNYPYAIEAIDVKFQAANRPKGTHLEGKEYWSEKHSSYGYKIEASVRPNGLASDFSFHNSASTADIVILQERLTRTQRRIRKGYGEDEISDTGILLDEYPDYWAIIADKGYQGIANQLRAVTPKKRPQRGVLTLSEVQTNRKISADRIIVENYFGRLGKLWGVCSKKFELSEVKYDTVVSLCMSLTNFHIDLHPLRRVDGDNHQRYKNRLLQIGANRNRSRSEYQSVYRSNRRQRTTVGRGSILD